MTGLVFVMAAAAIAPAPPPGLPWWWLAAAYIPLFVIAFQRARSATDGGIVPIGTHGDSRVVLAAVSALGVAAAPAEEPLIATIPFCPLVIAAGLCGAADGAWNAMAMRHLQTSFVQVLRTFIRAAWSPGACSWRIVMPGPGRDGP